MFFICYWNNIGLGIFDGGSADIKNPVSEIVLPFAQLYFESCCDLLIENIIADVDHIPVGKDQ